MALTDKLTAIANAIRNKTGKSDTLKLEEMPTEIASITTGSSDIPFAFGGMNAEKVAEYSETFTLADTSFVIGTTSSTSATTLKASVSNRFTSSSTVVGDKDVVVVQTVTVAPIHNTSATQKALINKYVIVYVTTISKGRASYTNASVTTRRTISTSYPFISYINTSGVGTIANSSYGFYATPSAASTASTTAATTTVRVSSPTLYSRASSTYESQANMKLVTDCTWEWNVEVYLVDSKSSINGPIQEKGWSLLFD